MILELKHPTLGPQGTVTLFDGVVTGTKWTGCCRPDPLKAMKGWIEASVREYAKSQNWIVGTHEDPKNTV